jgi:misacylated tRNA(Ala) deacylase
MPVNALFRDDFYLSTAEAIVTAVHEDGGIELDQTCFYATSGGQPGDSGFLERADGSRIELGITRNGADKSVIVHVPLEGQPSPDIGEKLTLHVDWPRRYKLMRMHTACHLLSVVCQWPITGAAVGEDESRVDFDMSETIDKDEVTAKLMELVKANHPRSCRPIPASSNPRMCGHRWASAGSASSASVKIPASTASPAAAPMFPKRRKWAIFTLPR